ncbi:hypothetical protein MC62_017015 [Citrobacter freundii]|nr:hypothetical protein MC62_017015 [Citrobacter freundii]EBY8079357.1 hypothetical protein [Salmonella enterica subsp. enterica serovar Senftenberg]KWQ65480.1 hypothetical protein AH91_16625 [Salmonella enterica subsp. enterica serovar Tennessee]KWQ84161.1 hypothetical protein AH90_00245 [Salmonella enterica subsp. enterica serovar Tennessee]KWR46623.1 hypothetical protein Y094_11580 [Salmonella enterica subsp. enterica serovar Tennessee]
MRDTKPIRSCVPACKPHYRWVSTVERSTQSEKSSKYETRILRSKLRIAQFTKNLRKTKRIPMRKPSSTPRGYWLY